MLSLKENGKLAHPADCATCDDKTRKCFNRMKSFTVKGPGIPTVDVTQDTWHFCVDAWRKQTGNMAVPDIVIITTYGICPVSIGTDFSYTMISLHHNYRPSRAYASVRDYYSEPALMMHGFGVINSETTRMQEYLGARQEAN